MVMSNKYINSLIFVFYCKSIHFRNISCFGEVCSEFEAFDCRYRNLLSSNISCI